MTVPPYCETDWGKDVETKRGIKGEKGEGNKLAASPGRRQQQQVLAFSAIKGRFIGY